MRDTLPQSLPAMAGAAAADDAGGNVNRKKQEELEQVFDDLTEEQREWLKRKLNAQPTPQAQHGAADGGAMHAQPGPVHAAETAAAGSSSGASSSSTTQPGVQAQPEPINSILPQLSKAASPPTPQPSSGCQLSHDDSQEQPSPAPSAENTQVDSRPVDAAVDRASSSTAAQASSSSTAAQASSTSTPAQVASSSATNQTGHGQSRTAAATGSSQQQQQQQGSSPFSAVQQQQQQQQQQPAGGTAVDGAAAGSASNAAPPAVLPPHHQPWALPQLQLPFEPEVDPLYQEYADQLAQAAAEAQAAPVYEPPPLPQQEAPIQPAAAGPPAAAPPPAAPPPAEEPVQIVIIDLGEGSFGTVRRGIWLGVEVAFKFFDKPRPATLGVPAETQEQFLRRVRREYHMQLRANIPHVARAFELRQGPPYPMIIMEACLCSLKQLVRNNWRNTHLDLLQQQQQQEQGQQQQQQQQHGQHGQQQQQQRPEASWPCALRLMSSAAGALAALHQLRIMHNDVRADNLLLTQAALPPYGFTWQLKLCDFGLAVQLHPQQQDAHLPQATNSAWLAPEVWQAQQHARRCAPATDVYAFGGVMYETMTGVLEPPNPPGFPGPAARLAQLAGDPPQGLAGLFANCVHDEAPSRPNAELAHNTLSALLGQLQHG